MLPSGIAEARQNGSGLVVVAVVGQCDPQLPLVPDRVLTDQVIHTAADQDAGASVERDHVGRRATDRIAAGAGDQTHTVATVAQVNRAGGVGADVGAGDHRANAPENNSVPAEVVDSQCLD